MTNKRTALVTGGMGGLGEAIAQKLHDAGHTVLVTHSPGNDQVQAWSKINWDAVLRTNLDSMLNVTKPFANDMAGVDSGNRQNWQP